MSSGKFKNQRAGEKMNGIADGRGRSVVSIEKLFQPNIKVWTDLHENSKQK
jgi:hypothetical protein